MRYWGVKGLCHKAFPDEDSDTKQSPLTAVSYQHLNISSATNSIPMQTLKNWNILKISFTCKQAILYEQAYVK